MKKLLFVVFVVGLALGGAWTGKGRGQIPPQRKPIAPPTTPQKPGTPAPPAGKPTPTSVLAGKPLTYWVKELKSSDSLICEEALIVLGDAGAVARPAVPSIEKLLEDTRSTVRSRAALALWKIDGRTRPAVKALTEMLRGTHATRRLEALRMLAGMGTAAAPAAEAIFERVTDSDYNVRHQAANTLVGLGEAGVPAVAKALKDKHVSNRQQAALMLIRFGTAANRAATSAKAALTDTDLQVRIDCARVLLRLGKVDKQVVKVLQEGIESKSSPRRSSLYSDLSYALSLIPTDKQKLVTPIIEAGMKSTSMTIRLRMAHLHWRVTRDKTRVLPLFMEGIKSNSSSIWYPAVQGLSYMGEDARPALPRLVELLKTSSGKYNTSLHTTLKQIGKPAVGPVLSILQEKKGDSQYENIARSLVSSVGKSALPATLPLLKDGDYRVRAAGCRIISSLGSKSSKYVPRLTELLKDSNSTTRSAAIYALGQVGPGAKSAVPRLMELARSKTTTSYHYAALVALGNIAPHDKAVVKLTRDILKDTGSSRTARVQALRLLWLASPKDPEILAQAGTLLKSSSTRSSTLYFLRQCGPAAAKVVPQVIECLDDPNTDTIRTAVQTLGAIGPAARPAEKKLLALLEHKDRYIRRYTVLTLHQIGADEKAVIPRVIKMLDSSDNSEVLAAIQVLGKYGAKASAAIPPLVRILKNPRSSTRFYAAEAIARIDPKTARKECVPILTPLVTGSSLNTTAASALALADPGNANAMSVFTRALNSTSTSTRRSALYRLSSLGTQAKPMLPLVKKLIDDKDTYTRIYAARALWHITNKAEPSFKVLLAIVTGPETTYNRSYAIRALAEMGPAARAAIPTIEKAQHDPSSTVRRAATLALTQLKQAQSK